MSDVTADSPNVRDANARWLDLKLERFENVLANLAPATFNKLYSTVDSQEPIVAFSWTRRLPSGNPCGCLVTAAASYDLLEWGFADNTIDKFFGDTYPDDTPAAISRLIHCYDNLVSAMGQVLHPDTGGNYVLGENDAERVMLRQIFIDVENRMA